MVNVYSKVVLTHKMMACLACMPCHSHTIFPHAPSLYFVILVYFSIVIYGQFKNKLMYCLFLRSNSLWWSGGVCLISQISCSLFLLHIPLHVFYLPQIIIFMDGHQLFKIFFSLFFFLKRKITFKLSLLFFYFITYKYTTYTTLA